MTFPDPGGAHQPAATSAAGPSAGPDGVMPADPAPADEPVGLVDGSQDATSQRFFVTLDEEAVVGLDELVVTSAELPAGNGLLSHYAIVVEASAHIEGAEMASDTHRIAQTKTMPGHTSRQVEVQLLRTVPERWVQPTPGAVVSRARGASRDTALFLDQMDQPLPVGLDQAGDPISVDFSFVNGTKGGHVSISGISGVATKTSYATFLLYMLLETGIGRAYLGAHAANTRALIFNVKGEDLLHLDRRNGRYPLRPEDPAGWAALGVADPGPFRNVTIYAPAAPGGPGDALAHQVVSRIDGRPVIYGWPPAEFIRHGLLRFCFAEDDDGRNHLSFIEERVRVQLARWAWPLAGEPGAVVLRQPPADTSYLIERVYARPRDELGAADGVVVRNFADLVDFLVARVTDEDEHAANAWTGRVAAGTVSAFVRRLYAQTSRIGQLVRVGVTPPTLASSLNVVDIHSLHDSAQRFVVGALVSAIFEEKQGSGREPLRLIVLDELNKYAPRHGSSPIKEVLVDIAARGRSLGVLLIGAQQSAADVDANIIRNAAVKVVGRLDAGEAGEYRFLPPELRERATRFLPGTMVLDQPMVPAPLPMRFPFPGYATCVAEARPDPGEAAAARADAMRRLL